MNSIVILFVLMMLVDIPMVRYLYQTTYSGMFTKINSGTNTSTTRLYTAGIIVYLLMAIGLYVFVISASTDMSFVYTILKGALLGVILFGVYDITNVATIPAFGIKEAVIDTIWGGTLFAIVTAMFLCINRIDENQRKQIN
jgi:uncharacterized membrane protein